jgi:excisionase family DNA binding protein
MRKQPLINGTPKSQWMTMAKVATESGFSRSTVDRARVRGDIESIKYGRLRLVRRSEFERWVETFVEAAA